MFAALLALLLLWWRWPSTPDPVPEPPPVAKADPPPRKEKPKDEKGKETAVAKPPVKPVVRTAAASPQVDAAALREAIAKRSKDLEACNASGAPERLQARLLMTRSGAIKTVILSQAGQVPAAVVSCVRERVKAWTFPELALSSDVDVMVTFSLTPGAVASPFAG